MSEYQVLARKCRPQKFADVVAQAPIVATLKNAIRMRRTAHAYLFCGSRGTGKTTLARLLAKALNCAALSQEIEPCNACASCREIASGHAIDVIEVDGASHRGIEDIRQINETIAFTSVGGRYKIYLIDEVHMLTKEAFNALLKTLEEPPLHVKFLFCTTEPHRIPATILSRCQRFNLRRIPEEKMEQKLAQIAAEAGIPVESGAFALIIQRAEGSLRDALSIFDQVIAFEKGAITASVVAEALGFPSQDICFALDAAMIQNDHAAIFKITAEIFASGQNLSHFLELLTTHFRTYLLTRCGGKTADKKYAQSAHIYRTEQIVRILEILIEGQQSLKSAPSERTALEILLLRILRTHHEVSLESLVERLISMEQRLSVSENPLPKPEELPSSEPLLVKPVPAQLSTPHKTQSPLLQEQAVSHKPQSISIQEQSRFDTVMRFAAKELNGSIKKDTSSHG